MSGQVTLREVRDADLPIFYEQQLEPEAQRMAGFAARGREAFIEHWAKIMVDQTTVLRTILFGDEVAGNVVCWQDGGERRVGYWLGKRYWGKGVASAALGRFLRVVQTRPLHARVAKHNAGSIRVLEKCGFAVCGEERFAGADGEDCEELVMRLA